MNEADKIGFSIKSTICLLSDDISSSRGYIIQAGVPSQTSPLTLSQRLMLQYPVCLHDARGIDRGEAGSIEAHLGCHEVTAMPADGHAIRERRLHWLRPPFL